jgi:hypothetical protein
MIIANMGVPIFMVITPLYIILLPLVITFEILHAKAMFSLRIADVWFPITVANLFSALIGFLAMLVVFFIVIGLGIANNTGYLIDDFIALIPGANNLIQNTIGFTVLFVICFPASIFSEKFILRKLLHEKIDLMRIRRFSLITHIYSYSFFMILWGALIYAKSRPA